MITSIFRIGFSSNTHLETTRLDYRLKATRCERIRDNLKAPSRPFFKAYIVKQDQYT